MPTNVHCYKILAILISIFTGIQTNESFENIQLALNDTGIDILLYCENGLPLLLADDTVKKCSPDANSDSSMSCPENFWCHVGGTQNSWYCCPKNRKVTERCYLAPVNGYGSGEIRRFWYDWKSSTCKQLTYAGYGGNENNFLTKIDCEKVCLGKKPPISTLTYSAFANKLGIQNNKVSTITEQSFIQNVGDLNPCELTPDRGTSIAGVSLSYRWYFDIAADRCIRFNYLGSAGNANNFETDRLCADICGTGNISDPNICLLPNIPGTGQYKIPRFYYDSRNKACKQFIYNGFGGNDNRFTKHEQCIKTCLNAGANISTATASSIIATTTIVPSQFVNTEISTTEMFTFFNNSAINFQKFKQQITSTNTPKHSAVTEEFKELIKTTTNVNDHIISFGGNYTMKKINSQMSTTETNLSLSKHAVGSFVDAITDPCLQSLSDGYQIQYCSPTDSFLCPHGTFCQVGTGPQETFCCPVIANNPCKQEQQCGIGHANLNRWYYDATDNHCKTFIFNGFKGNQNNFLTFRECQQSCGAINPCENGEPQIQTNPNEQCSPENIFSCPQGYYCRILDDLTKTACCPGSDKAMFINNGRSIISDFLATGNSGSDNTYNFKSDRTNIDYIRSGSFGSIDGTDIPVATVLPAQLTGYGNDNLKSIPFTGFLNAMGHISGTENYGNMSQPNFYISPIGTAVQSGIKPPNFIEAGTFINSYYGIPKNAMLPESSIGSGISVVPGGSPITGIGIPADSSVTGTVENVRIANREASNLTPNMAIETIRGVRCLLPVNPGTGSYRLQRYYFDSEVSLCRPFIYAGFDGNDNNFETIRECRMICPEYDNPCLFGMPFVDENDGSVAFCSASNSFCPTNYWCHIGDRRQTSVCCPSSSHQKISCDKMSENLGLLVLTVEVATNMNMLLPRSGSTFFPSNMMQNYDELAMDPGVHYVTENNDMPGTIPLACFQPMLEGKGQAKLTRYYFNGRTRTCNKFIYTGKGGNQNNFLSKSDCDETCPILVNPCDNGLPEMGPEGSPLLCHDDTSSATVCGIGYYCHIGATALTTVCCPAIGDPCHMPVSNGNGNSVLYRWYYNMQSQFCVSFAYSGQGGNANNFRTREDCIKTCPEFRNPCSAGRPHIGLNGQITHCGATGPLVCPTTYWCHIGETLENSVCCPSTGIPCEQELEIGNGNGALIRFYYDSTTRTCQQFQYSGLGGNENNFITLRDCEARCPVLPNPCGLGQPQLDEQQNPVLCSAADNSACDTGHFCHIGETEETTICCPGKSQSICNEPRVPGIGRANLNRYAFSSLTKQCLPFIYTGLGGNENNFLSRASCEATCPVVSNPCADGEPATGNDGQYLICSASGPNICPIGYWCHIGADIAASLCCPGAQNPCILPLAEGTGNSAIPRWYFDRRLRQCATFTYTGYGGNQNSFQTMQECQEKCPELTNPCSTGDPAVSSDGYILQCSAMQPVCPQSYYCSIGATFETSICCPSTGQPLLHNPCPTDSTERINNFVALTRCNARNAHSCPPTYWCHIGGDADTTVCCPGASNPCQLPLSQGIITDNEPYTRWFYDRISGSCKPFQYTGIGGNQNNFLTRSDCAKRCPEGKPIMLIAPTSLSSSSSLSLSANLPAICPAGIPYQERDGTIPHCSVTNPCPTSYFCHVGADISTTVCCKVTTFLSPCSIPVQIGHGTGHMQRVYYNAALRQCIPFIYSGMGGNENNFLTMEECTVKCLVNNNDNFRYFNADSTDSNCNGTNCNQTRQAKNLNRHNLELYDSLDSAMSNSIISWLNSTLTGIQTTNALRSTNDTIAEVITTADNHMDMQT
uniref:BPTI/Kunitz inhibitor domain-containing protein n=1 Tax=Setaria digitata TaxID=48799 RepID=A0A915PV89_9BILA